MIIISLSSNKKDDQENESHSKISLVKDFSYGLGSYFQISILQNCDHIGIKGFLHTPPRTMKKEKVPHSQKPKKRLKPNFSVFVPQGDAPVEVSTRRLWWNHSKHPITNLHSVMYAASSLTKSNALKALK